MWRRGQICDGYVCVVSRGKFFISPRNTVSISVSSNFVANSTSTPPWVNRILIHLGSSGSLESMSDVGKPIEIEINYSQFLAEDFISILELNIQLVLVRTLRCRCLVLPPLHWISTRIRSKCSLSVCLLLSNQKIAVCEFLKYIKESKWLETSHRIFYSMFWMPFGRVRRFLESVKRIVRIFVSRAEHIEDHMMII